MKFDKDFVFINEVKTHDAFGYEVLEVEGTVFKAFSTPVKSETTLREQGLITNKALRLITKSRVNSDESLRLKNVSTNVHYRVIESLNYDDTPYTIFLVEVI